MGLSVHNIKGTPIILFMAYHRTHIKVFWGSFVLNFSHASAQNSGQICAFTHKATILVAFLDLVMHDIKVPTKMIVIMWHRIHTKAFLGQ